MKQPTRTARMAETPSVSFNDHRARRVTRTLSVVLIGVAAFAIAALPARRGAADDETKDIAIEIAASLEATNCTAQPATVTVLGLTIDVSTAKVEANGSTTVPASPIPSVSTEDGGRRGKGGSRTQPTANCYYNFCTPAAVPTPTGCAALVVGQPVEVKLASDQTALVAVEVEQHANSIHNVELQAPLQAFDATTQTIAVLGLSVDVSGAGLDGADDESHHSQPISLSQLMIGQSIEVILASSAPPLVASELEVKNFNNQLRVDVTDPGGNIVGDVHNDGNPLDDVHVDVVQNVPVQSPVPGTRGTSGRQTLRFHTGSHGGFTLCGLATTRATIVVTRVRDGVTFVGRRAVPVKGNATRSLRVHLRPADSR